MVYVIFIGDTKNHHSRFVKVTRDLGEVGHVLDRFKRATDCVVDNISLTDTNVYVRTLACKDRGQQRTARYELKVDRHVILGREVVVYESADNLCLVTTVSQPNLNGIFALFHRHRTYAVVVTEEALEEARDLVYDRLPEVCLCARKILVLILDHQVVQNQRLGLCVTQPSTERTNVTLELIKVLCHLIVTVSHDAQQTGNLIKVCTHRALNTGRLIQESRNGFQLTLLNDHISHNVGHYAREAVVTVLIGISTRQLEDIEVVVIDGVQGSLYAADDIAHITERNLQTQRIFYACLEIELKLRRSVRQITGLPVGRIVKAQAVCLCKGHTVVAAAIKGKNSGGIHTVQNILTESCRNLIHTGLIYLKFIRYPLTGVLPLVAAQGVEHRELGRSGRRDCAGVIGHRVDRLRRSCIVVLCLDLDLARTRGYVFILLCVICVGHEGRGLNQTDLRDHDRLVNRLERQGNLAILIGCDHKLKGSLNKAVRILELISLPNRRLAQGRADLVFINILKEETEHLIIHNPCVGRCPRGGDCVYNVGCSVALLGLYICKTGSLSRSNVSICVLVLRNLKDGILICVLPILRDRQIASFRERNLAVDHKQSFNRRRLVGNRIIVDLQIVTSGILERCILLQRRVKGPNDRTGAGNVQSLNTVIRIDSRIILAIGLRQSRLLFCRQLAKVDVCTDNTILTKNRNALSSNGHKVFRILAVAIKRNVVLVRNRI